MRNKFSYDAVFSDRVPIELWPVLVGIMKAVEFGLIQAITKLYASENRTMSGERTFGTWRGAVALCVVAKMKGSFNFNNAELMETDVSAITPEFVDEIFLALRNVEISRSSSRARSRSYSWGNNDLRCRAFGNSEGLAGIDVIGQWVLPNGLEDAIGLSAPKTNPGILIDEDILARVNAALPEQPWPSGTQHIIAEQTGFDKKVVRECMNRLISSGVRHKQRDGIVVNSEGIIVAVDPVKASTKHVIGERYSE
jgi:hypothetical protein